MLIAFPMALAIYFLFIPFIVAVFSKGEEGKSTWYYIKDWFKKTFSPEGDRGQRWGIYVLFLIILITVAAIIWATI